MEKYRHIAFCALVSLGIHKKYHGINSFLQENIYILRWLNTAKREKRFSQTHIPYLDKLVELTNQHMSTSSMKKKLESFYHLPLPEHIAQSEYYQFSMAQESLKISGYPWFNLSTHELKKKLNSFSGQGIFTEKHAFNFAFPLQDKMTAPLRMIIPSMNNTIKKIFSFHNFKITPEKSNPLLWVLTTQKKHHH